MKDAQLMVTVYRRNPYYNYLLLIRSTDMAKPKCPGDFQSCLVNGRTTWSSSGSRAAQSAPAIYPAASTGVGANQRVYIGIQADKTPNDGYFIKYSICRKGSNGAWFGKNGAVCPIHAKF